jgi:hypothetical protein
MNQSTQEMTIGVKQNCGDMLQQFKDRINIVDKLKERFDNLQTVVQLDNSDLINRIDRNKKDSSMKFIDVESKTKEISKIFQKKMEMVLLNHDSLS